jgi:hypothetical protein
MKFNFTVHESIVYDNGDEQILHSDYCSCDEILNILEFGLHLMRVEPPEFTRDHGTDCRYYRIQSKIIELNSLEELMRLARKLDMELIIERPHIQGDEECVIEVTIWNSFYLD